MRERKMNSHKHRQVVLPDRKARVIWNKPFTAEGAGALLRVAPLAESGQLRLLRLFYIYIGICKAAVGPTIRRVSHSNRPVTNSPKPFYRITAGEIAWSN